MEQARAGPEGRVDAANVDTDAIIPKQFLQKVTRTGFGAHLSVSYTHLLFDGKNV